jgi:hydrogenase nickel incorporation protein HypA/HybF
MHELGIVFQIVKTVEQVAEENMLNSIKSVTLELGQVSGVVHNQLKNCWKWATDKSKTLNGTLLIIDEIPAVTFCETCNETYATIEYGKTCPHCSSSNTYLIAGSEMNDKEILAQ